MYNAPITRARPTAFVLVVDQSGSMSERIVFGGVKMTKARAVSLAASGFVDELIHRARREGGVRDYYDIAALGYSGFGVRSLLAKEFMGLSRLMARDVRREKISCERMLPSGRSAMAVTERNIWIEPHSEGATPMCAGLVAASRLVEKWCRRNPESYPPTVINITDGEASDGGEEAVREAAGAIRTTGTSDGATLLFNIHLAQGDVAPVIFPSSAGQLPTHRYARLLWEISSEMPPGFGERVDGTRAMGWNCDIALVAAMMNIGSVNSVML